MSPDFTKFHVRLVAELGEQPAAIADVHASTATATLDQSSVGRLSRMDAMQQQAVAQDLLARLDLRRRKVTAALGRVEAGSYGKCCECQAVLPLDRLEADPAAVFCQECAEERDAP